MFKFLTLIFLLSTFTSCFHYSVLDGSIDAETFSIQIFEEQAANSPAGYGAELTEYLKDFMISRSSLKLTTAKADLEMSGKITNYSVSPISIQSNEGVSQNRLSVTIQVTVINNVNEEESFEKSFSQISDFSSDSDLSSIESALLEDINGKLGQDIINKLTSNW